MPAKETVKEAKAAASKSTAAPSTKYETKYRIEELVDASKPLFDSEMILARAALKAAGKTEYTQKQAKEIVNSFKRKEVK